MFVITCPCANNLSLITLVQPFFVVLISSEIKVIQIKLVYMFYINTLGSRQNGHQFAHSIFKFIFLFENSLILIHISLKFIPKGRIGIN